jgi:hypothetical protein
MRRPPVAPELEQKFHASRRGIGQGEVRTLVKVTSVAAVGDGSTGFCYEPLLNPVGALFGTGIGMSAPYSFPSALPRGARRNPLCTGPGLSHLAIPSTKPGTGG